MRKVRRALILHPSPARHPRAGERKLQMQAVETPHDGKKYALSPILNLCSAIEDHWRFTRLSPHPTSGKLLAAAVPEPHCVQFQLTL